MIIQGQNPGGDKKKPDKPDIKYPCDWVYKVIGEDCTLLRDAVMSACAPHEVTITHSHASSKGKYHSLNAALEVPNEETRLQIYSMLKAHPSVKVVL